MERAMESRLSLKVSLGALLVGLALSPLPISGQEEAPAPVPHDQVISGSTLMLLAGWFNAEYEKKLSETMTAGVTSGWLEMDHDDYTNLSGFIRFYPQLASFRGFYVGGRGGFYRVHEGDDSHTALGLGVDVGFAWILGPARSFYVGIGIGADKLIAGDLGGASASVPSVRLVNIGIAF